MSGAHRTLFATLLLLALIAGALTFSFRADFESGLWSRLASAIQEQQYLLNGRLAVAMQAVQAEGLTATWALVGLSFLYGLFHAAGPGHGKFVISTYILAHKTQLHRGILLSFFSAFCQGLTAILVVSVTAGLLGFTLVVAEDAATGLEALSYGLVALLGLTLITLRIYRILQRRARSFGRSSGARQMALGAPASDRCGGVGCAHVYLPSSRDLETPLTLRGMIAVVASVGVRPCCGAVLVLLLAYSLDLYVAGITAVFAMSLGTAITVALIACIAVHARDTALSLAARLPNQREGATIALDIIALIGGAVLLILGASMLQLAFTASHTLN